MHRRTLLTSIAAAAGLASTTAAQGQTDPYAAKPDTVELVGYEPDTATGALLERYRPRLVTRDLEIEPTVYAWAATSSERDTTMYCYWASYPTQRGLSALDSHLGDREPVYVEVDQSGAIVDVFWDAWHYLRNAAGATVPQDDTHPLLYVQSPHHFYAPTSELGRLLDLNDMTDIYPSWHRNGWGVSRTALLDPWTMRERTSWWPQDTTLGFEISTGALGAELSLLLSSLTGGAATQTGEVA